MSVVQFHPWPPSESGSVLITWVKPAVVKVHFLNSGDPPVVFTLGTAVLNAGHFYHDSAEAAPSLEKRALVLVGAEPLEPALGSGPRCGPGSPY